MVHRRNSSVVKPVFPRSKPLVSSSSTATSLSSSSSSNSMSASLALPVSLSSAQLRGRRLRIRLTVLLILVVISVSTYLLCFSTSLTDYHTATLNHHHHDQSQHAGTPFSKPKPKFRPHKANALYAHAAANPPIKLNAEEELAAVSAHLAALPQNVIPSFVDPSKSIDPQLVLDFDVSAGKRSEEEVKMMVEQTWEHNPVVVYCKHYSPQSRSLRNILSTMDIHPPPTVFEVDLRPDSDVLLPLISRVIKEVSTQTLNSSRQDSDAPAAADVDAAVAHPGSKHSGPSSLPALLIGGKLISAGDVELVSRLLENGSLKEMIKGAGAEIRDAKRKKKGRR
jgi:hypothetical protein